MNSSFKIIEIQIKSEEDINFIHQRLIRQSDPKVKFINLDIKPDVSFHCKDKECPTKMGMFIVLKSGKSIIIWENLKKIHLQLQNPNSSIIYYEILEPVKSYYFSGDTYKRKVVEAHQKGIRIKNCFLCRYHGENRFYDDEKNPIYCKFLNPHSADIQAEVKEDRFGNTKLPNDCRAIVWEFLVYNRFLQ